MLERQQVMEILKNVYDPELMINIVDMGLVYGVEIEGNKARVIMTLTSPGCPMADMIEGETKYWVGKLENVNNVEVEFVFDPPWDSRRMSEDAKLMVGFDNSFSEN